MSTVGFLNLPPWPAELRQGLHDHGLPDLLRAPVLGTEDVDPPWTSFPDEEFFGTVDTGLQFADGRPPTRWPSRVITADAPTACRRFLNRQRGTTGVRGAIGGTAPLLDLFHARAGYPAPRRLLAMTDGVAGAVLGEMGRSGKTLEESLQEIQWRDLAPGNATRHLHGLVARDRLVLLGSLVFNITLDPEQVFTEGFGQVSPRDLALADTLDATIRLLGVVEAAEGGTAAWVRPVLLPSRYLLAQVRGGAEAAYLQLADQTSLFFSGPGTTPAVVLRGMVRDWRDLLAADGGPLRAEDSRETTTPAEPPATFYLRFALTRFDLTVSQVLNVLAEQGIGIGSLFQPPSAPGNGQETELVVFTRPVAEKTLQDALRLLRERVRLASLKTCLRSEG
ncbi:MAG: hypothetical protein GX442_14175 [Candidatus Riflebacteria bacterium]|nr:hypothetical protein [Candidatus Riflebacteria bacterium]